ncbi:MAG: CpsB/CapC family capsule biosynthesis tyrosine phosphatase, partial [Flavobacteriia bacterium]
IEYREKGVNIQVNLNSLTGHYGPEVRKQAQRLIDNELVDFVGTDCHRIQHQLLLEEHLSDPYFHKLGSLKLKNSSL